MLQNPLALAVLEGQFREGDAILADAGDGESLVFTREEGRAVDNEPEPSPQ
jgi:hypothetical protein